MYNMYNMCFTACLPVQSKGELLLCIKYSFSTFMISISDYYTVTTKHTDTTLTHAF